MQHHSPLETYPLFDFFIAVSSSRPCVEKEERHDFFLGRRVKKLKEIFTPISFPC